MSKRIMVLVLFLVVFIGIQSHINAQEVELKSKLELSLRKLSPTDMGQFWNGVRELSRLGEDAVDLIEESATTSKDPWVKLGCANSFLLMYDKEPKKALELFSAVIEDSTDNRRTMVMAVNGLGATAPYLTRIKPLKNILADLGKKTVDPAVKIAIAAVNYSLGDEETASDQLKKYLASTDLNLRYSAALALARNGNTEDTKTALLELSQEKSVRGAAAVSYLKNAELLDQLLEGNPDDEATRLKNSLQAQISKMESQIADLKNQLADAQAGIGVNSSKSAPLIDELILKIQKLYIDEGELITTDALINAAAKGMVKSLDPFSAYYDEADMKSFSESLNQTYRGIGVYVEKRPTDGAMVITQPIYSGPAYKAGLLSGDIITAVGEVSVADKEMRDIIKLIKGPEGTPVTISVYRKGWSKTREFTIIRASIVVKDVLYEMLPGKVGYLKQTTFGDKTSNRVRAALEDLKKQGMESLILDLRNNGGGLLHEAVSIASCFLGPDKLVVEVRARQKGQVQPNNTSQPQVTDVPMIVLLNENSASASEALSGALRDHKRATIVGVKSFGKGSVQRLFQMTSTQNKTSLRLTFAKYYFPNGESPHKIGVTPEHIVESATLPFWTLPEIDKAKEDSKIINYVKENVAGDTALMKKLAYNDHRDTSLYPNFDTFFKSLNTKLDPGHVRLLIRRHIRNVVADSSGKRLVIDLEEDVQLQKGIEVILSMQNKKTTDYKDYADFKKTEEPK